MGAGVEHQQFQLVIHQMPIFLKNSSLFSYEFTIRGTVLMII